MDIHDVRRELRTKSIYEIPLRVTYYARVSSESDEQLNSLGNQIKYYEDFIRRNAAWEFVPGYIDEGLSGISTKRRENFNRMVDDAAHDKFDLVITKEISRFARNTLDSIRYTRELLSDGVGVFFQNDNINTLDEDSELRLSIMSSIAQDELRKLSSRVKFGHQQAIKSSVVLGNSRIFGYRKDNKRLVIDEEQAPMVRELFELYATDEYSMKQLETLFWNKGYRNLNGKKIAHSTMSNMIANPKYKGYYVGNKVKVVDMFTKKQKFLPPEEWVMFKDETGEIVPAIVSEELWDAANAILRRRSDDVKHRQGICNHANLLTGKLYCAHCGAAYYRRESRDKLGNVNSRWVCSGKINNGSDSCPSFAIYEDEIKPLLFEVFRDTHDASEEMILEYERMYAAMTSDVNLEGQISDAEGKIELALKKKSKLLELTALGQITNEDFAAMTAACNEEIKAAEQELAELRSRRDDSEDFRRHMEKIRSTLRAAERQANAGAITKEFVDTFVDKIIATPIDDHTMRLDVKIFTGETTSRYLEKLARRTGHTFKKMIEAYENGMK
jgi:site-specific DNA recombinase